MEHERISSVGNPNFTVLRERRVSQFVSLRHSDFLSGVADYAPEVLSAAMESRFVVDIKRKTAFNVCAVLQFR